jgi:fructuronate reductase
VIPRLDRASAAAPEAAPVRLVHLGLGAFHRAHQAWYTMADPEWGIAAYTFRNTETPRLLAEQGGLYSVLVRGESGDTARIVPSISRAHPGTDRARWLADVASADVAAITLTVTESAYRPAVPGDDTAVTRLIDGFVQRWRMNSAPLAVVPCDNLPGNGQVLRRAVHDSLAPTNDPAFARWIDDAVSFVDTVVDRITPAAVDADRAAVAAVTGLDDRVPVVTEPFTEWLLAGAFPLGRPRWEVAGARLVDDLGPYQERKLWFLNGAHSLLAYVGLAKGLATVRDAVHDKAVAEQMESWWDTAARHTSVPPEQIADYRARLRERFAAPGIRHQLAQIGKDGSQKIPARIFPVLRAERRTGRLPGGAVTAVAAWLVHLRDGEVHDPRAAELVPLARSVHPTGKVLRTLDKELGDDRELITAIENEISFLPPGE